MKRPSLQTLSFRLSSCAQVPCDSLSYLSTLNLNGLPLYFLPSLASILCCKLGLVLSPSSSISGSIAFLKTWSAVLHSHSCVFQICNLPHTPGPLTLQGPFPTMSDPNLPTSYRHRLQNSNTTHLRSMVQFLHGSLICLCGCARCGTCCERYYNPQATNACISYQIRCTWLGLCTKDSLRLQSWPLDFAFFVWPCAFPP